MDDMRLPFNGDFLQSQGFGSNPDSYAKFLVLYPDGTRKPMAGHNGLDYATPIGTPIIAPHSGQVIEATYDEFGYGHYVKIENDREGSVLAHLSKIDVQVGFHVTEGDQIGLSGNSGNVWPIPTPEKPGAGAHTHWGYYTLPRNRANGFAGFINQEPLVEDALEVLYTFKYTPGDEIIPSVTIPVGSEPGKEDLSYGKISPTAPAKIKGFEVFNTTPYYNIDQTHIGGGTGWARADVIDATPMYVPPANKNPQVDGSTGIKTYTEDQFRAMEAERNTAIQERDKAIRDKQDCNDRNDQVKLKYSSFVALGFDSASDVTNALQKKDDTIIDLNKQLQQVYQRNSDLAKMVEKKESEDATAIDEGIRAMKKAQENGGVIKEVAHALGTKPRSWDILYRIKELTDGLKKGVDALEDRVKSQPIEKTLADGRYGYNYMMKLLGLRKEVSK
jgi:hypothetical protein